MTTDFTDRDTASQFLKQMSDHPLLTKEEECWLAKLAQGRVVSRPLRFSVDRQCGKMRANDRPIRSPRTAEAVRIVRPHQDERVSGRIHFSLRLACPLPDFPLAGLEIVIKPAGPGKRRPVARLACRHHGRWGWYARCDDGQIDPGRYIAVVQAGPSLQRAALEEFMRCNYRLVLKIANKFLWSGMDMIDLFTEGTLGLQKGVGRFEPERGYRFCTYAGHWIRQSISRAVYNQSRTIRIPVHQWGRNQKLAKSSRRVADSDLCPPELETLAEDAQIDLEHAKGTQRAFQQTMVPLETPIGPDGNGTLADVLEDDPDGERDPHNLIECSELNEKLDWAIAQLDPREQAIIRLRFGLTDDRDLTLEKVGKRFGVTRERIRQIEEKVLGKLRRHLARQGLTGI